MESYHYNFEALNYPEDHPAIDEQMSFYITEDRLLRTHTTAYQHRQMENRKPPIKVCTTRKVLSSGCGGRDPRPHVPSGRLLLR